MSAHSIRLACGLMEINAKIGEVRPLTRLDLSLNDVKELPASFASLTSLEWLSLSQNTSLNAESIAVALSHLPHLSSLYLDQCYLSSLPIGIVTITSLKVLSARENVLASLPPTFNGLTNLEELYLGSGNNAFRINVIPSLPIGFGTLKKLRILDLSGNHLSDSGS
jgi:Leucine-rich repeat (LRR) protein